MDFREFEDHFRDTLIIKRNTIRLLEYDFYWNRLTEWQRAGYLHTITNGNYMLDIQKRNLNELGLYTIAKEIYPPAYVSLESALSYHNLIPEGIYSTTCITTRKTAKFKTPVGNFAFKSIKPTLFIGYEPIPFNKETFLMAKKEKAIIDYLYYHPEFTQPGDMHEIRINTDELLRDFDEDLFWTYARIAQNKHLEQRAKVFLDYWRSPTYAHY